jgi:hypothetical protein
MASDDDGAYYEAWYGHAKLHRAKADKAKRRGRTYTARYHYLRATVYASVSYKLLVGKPVDPRLSAAFNTQLSSFKRALALTRPTVEPLDVKLHGHRLSAFFCRAAGEDRHRRPTIITVNGYDASISDMYLAMGHQAAARGYHVVLVDGPGQGKLQVLGRHRRGDRGRCRAGPATRWGRTWSGVTHVPVLQRGTAVFRSRAPGSST